MTRTSNDYSGPERREEREMDVLAAEIKHIKDTISDPVYGLRSLAVKIENMERRNTDSCKECATWARLAELEKQVERSKGMAVGISSVIGLAWAVISFVVSHK